MKHPGAVLTILTPPCRVDELWGNAYALFRKQLSEKELARLGWDDDPQMTVDRLKIDIRNAIQITIYQRFRFTPNIQKILQAVNTYAVAGDILVQSNPEFTSIAWGAFRFVLLVCCCDLGMGRDGVGG